MTRARVRIKNARRRAIRRPANIMWFRARRKRRVRSAFDQPGGARRSRWAVRDLTHGGGALWCRAYTRNDHHGGSDLGEGRGDKWFNIKHWSVADAARPTSKRPVYEIRQHLVARWHNLLVARGTNNRKVVGSFPAKGRNPLGELVGNPGCQPVPN